MTKPELDVLTVGNAIVDIIASTQEDFLAEQGIIKGAMNLVDAERSAHLYAAMGPAIEASGGSAGNTAAGVASFGGKAGFVGKVNNDQLGKFYTHDIRAVDVEFDTVPLQDGIPTATSMIFITPDGERSMNTYLGACVELGVEDIDEDQVARSGIIYFEGYLWDPPRAKDAIRHAAEVAHENSRQVSFTLSDPFCVDRYRDEFLDLMRSGTVDIIFANEEELKSLYQTSSLDAAVEAVRSDCKLAAVTLGEKGSMFITREATGSVDAHPIDKLVDTTGAGDLYAAGFLYGLSTGADLKTCARLGGLAAAEVIQHLGPRPQTSLKQLAEQSGF